MTAEPTVLLVDDSPNDALLMATVFQRTGQMPPLRSVESGEEAIAYFSGTGRFGSRAEFPMPSIVLLDLNMPRKNGFEVLGWIRSQPAYNRIHVYILSASSRREDIERAHDLGANAYLVKPGNLDGLQSMAETLVTWLKLGRFSAVDDPHEDLRRGVFDAGSHAHAHARAEPAGHRWLT